MALGAAGAALYEATKKSNALLGQGVVVGPGGGPGGGFGGPGVIGPGPSGGGPFGGPGVGPIVGPPSGSPGGGLTISIGDGFDGWDWPWFWGWPAYPYSWPTMPRPQTTLVCRKVEDADENGETFVCEPQRPRYPVTYGPPAAFL